MALSTTPPTIRVVRSTLGLQPMVKRSPPSTLSTMKQPASASAVDDAIRRKPSHESLHSSYSTSDETHDSFHTDMSTRAVICFPPKDIKRERPETEEACLDANFENSLITPSPPKTPRPDSPYPAKSINSRRLTTRSLSSPRIEFRKVASASVPEPVEEEFPSLSSDFLVIAIDDAPNKMFKGGHFELVVKKKPSSFRRFLLCSAFSDVHDDDKRCSKCHSMWKSQTYGKRCEGGMHFMRDDKMYEFIGEKFPFEAGGVSAKDIFEELM